MIFIWEIILYKLIYPFRLYGILNSGSIYHYNNYDINDPNMNSAELTGGQLLASDQRERSGWEPVGFSAVLPHRLPDWLNHQLRGWQRVRSHLQKGCMSKPAFSKHFSNISTNLSFQQYITGGVIELRLQRQWLGLAQRCVTLSLCAERWTWLY